MIIKELFAKLGLDVDLEGFAKAEGLIGGLKVGLGVLAAALGAAALGITHMVMETADAGKHFELLAQKTGLTTDDLQGLAYAASRVGIDLEEFSHGVIHLTRHMNAARNGQEEASKAFTKLGVKVVGADGKLRDAGDTLMDLAEHFAAMPDGPEKTAAALEVFGKSGAAMIPLLNKGASGIEALTAAAKEMGIILDDDAIQKSLELKTAMGDLKAGTTALQYAIAVPLMGTLTEYVKALGEWIKSGREITKARVEKVVDLIRIALKLVLPPLKLLLWMFGLIIDNWRMIAVILSSIVLAALVVNAAAVLATAQAYLFAGAAGVAAGVRVAAAWVLANAPLIIMTAIFALIILLLDDVATAMRGGKSVLKEWLDDWKDPGNEAWWLRDLKALSYLMLHMDPIFAFWKDQINKLWEWMKTGFIDTWDDMVVGVKKMFGIADDRNVKKEQKRDHLAFGYTSEQPSMGGGEWKDDGNGMKLWYPFSNVNDAANARSRLTSERRTAMQVNQTINAGANASAQEIANASVDALDEWHGHTLGKAASEF